MTATQEQQVRKGRNQRGLSVLIVVPNKATYSG